MERYDRKTDEEENVEEESQFVRIKPGKFTVQVHVIEARKLVHDFSESCDFVCQASVLGQTETTSIHKDCVANVTFDERLRFSLSNVSEHDLEQFELKLSIYDGSEIYTKNQLIGDFKFDLVTIYYKEHHELYQQWVALTNILKNYQNVFGYLKVSIVILANKDEQYIHPEYQDISISNEQSLSDVMIPNGVVSHPHILKAKIYELDKLPIMDKLTKSSDPYVKVYFAGKSNKTKVYKKCLDCQIHEELRMPVMEPLLTDTIIIHVHDHDFSAGSDDVIGTIRLSYNEIKTKYNGTRQAFWAHMYGAPDGASGKLANKMNEGISGQHEASCFRGSVLLGLDVEKTSTAHAKLERVPAQWKRSFAPRITKWVLQVDCYQAIRIHNLKGEYSSDWSTLPFLFCVFVSQCLFCFFLCVCCRKILP